MKSVVLVLAVYFLATSDGKTFHFFFPHRKKSKDDRFDSQYLHRLS